MNDERSIEQAILELLERWKRLPLSDLVEMLHPLQRPHFRKEILEQLQADGRLNVGPFGDELMVELHGWEHLPISAPPPDVAPSSEVL